MVTYEGYCRPLKQKVQFIVESVNSLDTTRGIKWSIKGNYDGHKISTFTNKAQAELLLNQLNDGAEDLEVFGAEIAVQEADTVGEMDYEGNIIFCDDDGKGSACEESYCHRCNPIEGCTDHDKCQEIGRFEADEVIQEAETITPKTLSAKHYRKDGSLDMRYKICREMASEQKAAESKPKKVTKDDKKVIDEVEDVATEVAVDSVMDAESFDAETYNKVYRAEPNAIIFEEHIPAEVWNTMGPDAQGHYLSTRDETVLIAPCCGVTKAELRLDEDANADCNSCCYSGDDFHPRWWANRPKPQVRIGKDSEDLPVNLTYGNTATVPVDIYYKFMLELPSTVSATVTDDGFSMILGFHNQDAALIDALIEGYSPHQDAGNPSDTLYAENTLSFVPSGIPSTHDFEAESQKLESHYSNVLNYSDAELDALGAEYMGAERGCYPCPDCGTDMFVAKHRYGNSGVGTHCSCSSCGSNYNTKILGAEEFNVEFDDWGKQEMKTHGKNISFKEWIKEEGDKHGDVPLTDWAEHEEESHDERYGAEETLYWSHKRNKECSYCGHGKNHKAALLSDDGKLFGCYKCNSYPNEEEMVADYEAEDFEAEKTIAQEYSDVISDLGDLEKVVKKTVAPKRKPTKYIREAKGSIIDSWRQVKKDGFSKELYQPIVKDAETFEEVQRKEATKLLNKVISFCWVKFDMKNYSSSSNTHKQWLDEEVKNSTWGGELHDYRASASKSKRNSHNLFYSKQSGIPQSNLGYIKYYEYDNTVHYRLTQDSIDKVKYYEQRVRNYFKNQTIRLDVAGGDYQMPLIFIISVEKESFEAETLGAEFFDAEKGELKKDSCCCGATKKNPCECMYEGVMNCSATSPMCPCYKAINKGVTDKYWGDIAKAPPWDTGFWAESKSFEAYGRMPAWRNKNERWNKNHFVWASDSKAVREAIKTAFPEQKFSVRIVNGQYIDVAVKSGTRPADIQQFKEDVEEVAMKALGEIYKDSSEELRDKSIYFNVHERDFGAEMVVNEIGEHTTLDAESFEADATSCFECGRFGYDDEMMRIDYGYLCARCSNPDVDFSKIMSAEDSKKINKKFIGLLGIGALGAYFAPREIKKLFDNMKKS